MENDKNWRKYVLGALGSIFLGALGSGLWSLSEFPIARLGNWLLTGVTLNLTSVRDGVYARAALGPREAAALFLDSIVVAGLVSFALVTALRIAAAESLKRLVPNAFLERSARIARLLAGATMLAIAAVMFVQMLMVAEEIYIGAKYRQYLTIIHPFVSEGDYQHFASALARMKTKEQFLNIMGTIRSIGRSNGVDMPTVDAW